MKLKILICISNYLEFITDNDVDYIRKVSSLYDKADIHLFLRTKEKCYDIECLKNVEFNKFTIFYEIESVNYRYEDCIHQLYESHTYDMIIAKNNLFTNTMLTKLSYHLNCIPNINCSSLDVVENGNKIEFKKEMFGGKILTTMGLLKSDQPIIITTNSIVEKKIKCQYLEKTEIKIDSSLYEDKDIKILEKRLKSNDKVSLNDASIIVSAGRGVKSKEDFKIIEDFANKLNASVGASRAIIDEGLLEEEWQVGQTGKNVNPELYVAIGISGATQHIAGMKNSKKVISINKDENAEIFKYSDYGIIGDLYELVPEITKKLN